MGKEPKKSATFRLSLDALKLIKKAADKRKMSQAEYIESLVMADKEKK